MLVLKNCLHFLKHCVPLWVYQSHRTNAQVFYLACLPARENSIRMLWWLDGAISPLKTLLYEFYKLTMSGNQLPVSASMWQRWSQICFATFTWQKILKFPNNSATTEAAETKFENYQILLNKNSHRFLVTTNLFSGSLDQLSP